MSSLSLYADPIPPPPGSCLLISAAVISPSLSTSQAPGVQPRRIALFSLGNLCVYRVCRDRCFSALQPPLDGVLDRIVEAASAGSGSGVPTDETIVKYVARIRAKLAQAPH